MKNYYSPFDLFISNCDHFTHVKLFDKLLMLRRCATSETELMKGLSAVMRSELKKMYIYRMPSMSKKGDVFVASPLSIPVDGCVPVIDDHLTNFVETWHIYASDVDGSIVAVHKNFELSLMDEIYSIYRSFFDVD